MKQTYLIKRSAKADVKEIARYTRKIWGRSLEQVYIKDIFDCFAKIAKRETFNIDYSHIKVGCSNCKVNHHLVFFHWLEDGRTEIIRVLHEEMDIPMQLVKS